MPSFPWDRIVANNLRLICTDLGLPPAQRINREQMETFLKEIETDGHDFALEASKDRAFAAQPRKSVTAGRGRPRKSSTEEETSNTPPRIMRKRVAPEDGSASVSPPKRVRVPTRKAEESAKQSQRRANRSGKSKTPTKRKATSSPVSPAKKKASSSIFDGVQIPKRSVRRTRQSQGDGDPDVAEADRESSNKENQTKAANGDIDGGDDDDAEGSPEPEISASV